MSLSADERRRLRHYARTSPCWVRAKWWFEFAEIGTTPEKMVDEEGMFDRVQGLRNGRKRLRSKALERFKVMSALHGTPYTGIAPPWERNTRDPRALQGPKQDIYSMMRAQIFTAGVLLPSLRPPTAPPPQSITLTGRAVATKNSSP